MISSSRAASKINLLDAAHLLLKTTTTKAASVSSSLNINALTSISSTRSAAHLELPFLCPALLDQAAAADKNHSSASSTFNLRASTSRLGFNKRPKRFHSFPINPSRSATATSSRVSLEDLHQSTRALSSSSTSISDAPPSPCQSRDDVDASRNPTSESDGFISMHFSSCRLDRALFLLLLTFTSSHFPTSASLSLASYPSSSSSERVRAETLSLWQMEMDESLEEIRRKEIRSLHRDPDRNKRKSERTRKQMDELTRRSLEGETGIENSVYLERRQEKEMKERSSSNREGSSSSSDSTQDVSASSSSRDLYHSDPDPNPLAQHSLLPFGSPRIRRHLINFLEKSQSRNPQVQSILESCYEVISRPTNPFSQQLAFEALTNLRTLLQSEMDSISIYEARLATHSLLLSFLQLNNRVALQTFFSFLSTLSSSSKNGGMGKGKAIWPLDRDVMAELIVKLGFQKRFWGVLKLFEIENKNYSNFKLDPRSEGDLDEDSTFQSQMNHQQLRAQAGLCQWEEIYDQHLTSPSNPSSRLSIESFELLLRSGMRMRDINLTNSILKKMKEEGLELTSRNWMALIRGWKDSRIQFYQLSNDLESRFKENQELLEAHLDVRELNQLLRTSSSAQDLESCLLILRGFNLFDLSRRDLNDLQTATSIPLRPGSIPTPNSETFAILCQFLGKLRRPALALRCFKEALKLLIHSQVNETRSGIVQNLQKCCQGVILGFLSSGRPMKALDFGSLALGRTRSYVDGSKVKSSFGLEESQIGLIEPSSYIYSSLLHSAASPQVASVNAARNILLDMFENGFKMQDPVRRAMAGLVYQSIGKGNDYPAIKRSFGRFDEGESNGSVEGNEVESLSDQNSEKEMRRFLEVLKDQGFEEAVTLAERNWKVEQKAISSTSSFSFSQRYKKRNARNRPSISHLSESSQELSHNWAKENSLGPGLDPVEWASSSLEPLSSRSPPELKPSTIQQSLVTSSTTSHSSTSNRYALRIRIQSLLKGDIESSIELYKEMESLKIKPLSVHISPIIEGLVQLNRMTEAESLLISARRELGIKPSIEVWIAFVEHCIQNRDLLKLEKVFKLFREEGGAEIKDRRFKNVLEDFRLNFRNLTGWKDWSGRGWEIELNRLLESSPSESNSPSNSSSSLTLSPGSNHFSQSSTLNDPFLRRILYQSKGNENLDPYLFHIKFLNLNSNLDFFKAQIFLSDSLREGLKPNLPIVYAFKRSGNWIRRHLNLVAQSPSPLDKDVITPNEFKSIKSSKAQELVEALEVYKMNFEKIKGEEERLRVERKKERLYREQVVDLVLSVVDGTIKREGLERRRCEIEN